MRRMGTAPTPKALSDTMPNDDRPRQLRFDPVTGPYVLGALVIAAAVLGFLALTHQGSPRMDDKAIQQQGATIPNPTALSPAQTSGANPPAR
jgi:hypothetical protein